MHVRVKRQFDLARVYHDELRSAAHCAFDSSADDRVRFGRIAAYGEDQSGRIYIGQRVGSGPSAEHLLHSGHSRAMADTGAVIDVVVAQADTRELLHEVV